MTRRSRRTCAARRNARVGIADALREARRAVARHVGVDQRRAWRGRLLQRRRRREAARTRRRSWRRRPRRRTGRRPPRRRRSRRRSAPLRRPAAAACAAASRPGCGMRSGPGWLSAPSSAAVATRCTPGSARARVGVDRHDAGARVRAPEARGVEPARQGSRRRGSTPWPRSRRASSVRAMRAPIIRVVTAMAARRPPRAPRRRLGRARVVSRARRAHQEGLGGDPEAARTSSAICACSMESAQEPRRSTPTTRPAIVRPSIERRPKPGQIAGAAGPRRRARRSFRGGSAPSPWEGEVRGEGGLGRCVEWSPPHPALSPEGRGATEAPSRRSTR